MLATPGSAPGFGTRAIPIHLVLLGLLVMTSMAHAQGGDFDLNIGGVHEQVHVNTNNTWDNDTTGESGTWSYNGNDIVLMDDLGNVVRVLENAKNAANGATGDVEDPNGKKIGTWEKYEAAPLSTSAFLGRLPSNA